MDDRVAALEARIAELEHQLTAPATSSRRHLLRLAGATMVGSAFGIASTRATFADEGLGVVGAPTTSTDVIRHSYTGGSAAESGVVFQAGTSFNSNNSAYPAALAGWSGMGEQPVNGVYGYAAGEDRVGVIGFNSESDGIGVLGRCDDGTGIRGVATSGTAISAVSVTGTGMFASGRLAASAEGDEAGLLASGSGPDGIGVIASGTATGIMAVGAYGLEALVNPKANLLLRPNNDGDGVVNPKTPPPSRTDAHLIGELDNVDGVLWWCVADGTPGTWRTLGGPASAGAFHPIAPVRVYDSRLSIPDPGVMSSGTSRMIGVADARDTTGAVATPDVVPVGATAIAYNLTVTETVGSGFLSIAPGDATSSTASSINWSANGQNLANGLVVKLDDLRRVIVFAGGGGSTHVVIDVLGFYR